MAGFFGFFDYTKPGRGVERDEPPKKPFFLYWELMWRKFSRLVVCNLIYFVLILPILVYVYAVWAGHWMTLLGADFQPPLFLAFFSFVEVLPRGLTLFLLLLSLVLYGPATCGLTYMLRSVVQQQHAWYSDFFQRAKENFRQGLFFGLLDVALAFVLVANFQITGHAVEGDTAVILLKLSRYLSVGLFLFYLFLRHTTYLQVVTVSLPVRHILKNAAILALVGLPRHFLITVVIAGTLILFTQVHALAELLTLPLLAFSFWGYTSVFISYPLIVKYIVNPHEEAQKERDNV